MGETELRETNTVLGTEAGAALSAPEGAEDNTLIGYGAGKAMTTGRLNVGVGEASLLDATTAEGNVAVGPSAGMSITTAKSNTAVGDGALLGATTGGDNVAVGENAGRGIKTGVGNVCVGPQVGEELEGAASHILEIGSGLVGKHILIRGNMETPTLGLYGVTPVARAAAIASPAEELKALKKAVDELREAVKNIGITE